MRSTATRYGKASRYRDSPKRSLISSLVFSSILARLSRAGSRSQFVLDRSRFTGIVLMFFRHPRITRSYGAILGASPVFKLPRYGVLIGDWHIDIPCLPSWKSSRSNRVYTQAVMAITSLRLTDYAL